MAATIKDIAKVAGVNYSTVSRALNDSPLVNYKTKRRIIKIAKEMGFEFDANARYMATARTGTIGIIYPEDFDAFGAHLYYSSLHSSMRRSLEKMELDLIVAFPSNLYNGKDNIRRLIGSRKVDGLILANPFLEEETLAYLRESGVPFVFFHHPTAIENVDEITTDHAKGGYLAGRHLLDRGRKKILCLSGGPDLEFGKRIEGCARALEEAGIAFSQDQVVQVEKSFETGHEAVLGIFREGRPYDAIFATTDLIAWGAIEALKELGIRVPEDVSVVGYDDVPIAECIRPALTTVHQPKEEIADMTCERLFKKITEPETAAAPRKLAVEPNLVVRAST